MIVLTITPGLGFAVNTTTLDLTEVQLSIVFEALRSETGIDEAVERNIYLAAVVHLSNPVEETDKPDEFLSLLSPSQSVDLTNPLTFNVSLDSMEGQLYNAYQARKVFAALFTSDTNNKPVHFSNTITG